MGGALSLEKCSWSGLFYFFKAGQWKLHSSQSHPAILTIQDGQQVTPLKHYEPDEAIKVVRVHQALSSSMEAQITSLTEKSNTWATAIQQGHLDRKIFWQGLHTMIWPSLRYPLAVSSIFETAAIGITKMLFKALLPKLGANQSYPMALCFTPPALFGLGLPNLYWEQGATALHLFLEVGNGFLADGHLLQCSLEQAQLEIGLSSPLFQADYSRYGFLLTDCWVKFLWSFLAYSDCSLFAESPPDLDLQ